MKFSFLPLLFLCITIPGMAQFQLAPIAGLNISKFRISNNAVTEGAYSNINGFMGGLNAKYGFENRFNLQLEAAYSQKGFESQLQNGTGELSVHLNYLDLLVIGEYALNDIIAFNFGGNFGNKIGENFDGSKNSPIEIYTGKDIGLIGGLKFYVGNLFFRTTYQHGLNPIESVILTNENGMTTGQSNAYNQTFQVAVGYYFSEPYSAFN